MDHWRVGGCEPLEDALQVGVSKPQSTPAWKRVGLLTTRHQRVRSRSAPELQIALFRIRAAGARIVPETFLALEDATRQVVFLRHGSHDVIAVAQRVPEDLRRKRA